MKRVESPQKSFCKGDGKNKRNIGAAGKGYDLPIEENEAGSLSLIVSKLWN